MKPEKTRRTITIDSDIEDMARLAAARERMSTSSWINRALREHLNGKQLKEKDGDVAA
jgi:hypothetical protein